MFKKIMRKITDLKKKKQIAPAILEKHNSNWIKIFAREKKIISDSIGKYMEHIDHIGSTAIPDIKAKPEIDILIGVKDINRATKVKEPLQRIGYVYFPKFEKLVPERRYFRKSKGIVPLVHIHMVETKSNFYRDHIAFRDYMIEHPEEANRYEKLKEKLLKKFNGDRGGYTDGKGGSFGRYCEKWIANKV